MVSGNFPLHGNFDCVLKLTNAHLPLWEVGPRSFQSEKSARRIFFKKTYSFLLEKQNCKEKAKQIFPPLVHSANDLQRQKLGWSLPYECRVEQQSQTRRDRQRNLAFIGSLPQWPCQLYLDQAELRARNSFQVYHVGARIQDLRPSSTVFPRTLARSWIGNGAAGTWTSAVLWDFSTVGQWLKVLSHSTSPRLDISELDAGWDVHSAWMSLVDL